MLLTHYDRDQLLALLKSSQARAAVGNALWELARKLDSATLVSSEMIPPEVVTMNSVVSLTELTSGSNDAYSLVYPKDANVDGLKISVLARLGVAMLGEKEGNLIEYATPAGTRRYLVGKVLYQPESRLRQAGKNGAHAL